VLHGSAYEVREQIRAAGGIWDQRDRVWVPAVRRQACALPSGSAAAGRILVPAAGRPAEERRALSETRGAVPSLAGQVAVVTGGEERIAREHLFDITAVRVREPSVRWVRLPAGLATGAETAHDEPN
jgi:hypothetical protein